MEPKTDLTGLSILRRVLDLLVTTISTGGSGVLPFPVSSGEPKRSKMLPDLRVMVHRGVFGPLFVPTENVRTVLDRGLSGRLEG